MALKLVNNVIAMTNSALVGVITCNIIVFQALLTFTAVNLPVLLEVGFSWAYDIYLKVQISFRTDPEISECEVYILETISIKLCSRFSGFFN